MTFTRHVSLGGVSNSTSTVGVQLPVRCILMAVTLICRVSVTGAAAGGFGHFILSLQDAAVQLYGSGLANWTADNVFAGLVVGDPSTVAFVQAYNLVQTSDQLMWMEVPQNGRIYAQVFSNSANATTTGEAFLRFRA